LISRDIIRSNASARRLGDVVEFLDARRRPIKEWERKPGPFPYYGANGQQGTIDGYLFDEPLVLLAEDGGFFDQPQRGVAYRISGKTWVNNHAHVLRPKQSMDVGFLCRVLENYDLAPFITGTTRGKLTKAGAEEVLVPVPPLDEQRRIAAILDQADDLRRKRREALKRLNRLIAATFFGLFGTREQWAARWNHERLSAVTKPKQWRTISSEELKPFGYPVYGANGVIGFYDEFNHLEPTVLITCRGATCGTINVCEAKSYVTGNAMALDEPAPHIDLQFLEWALKFRGLADAITGSAQPQITRQSLAGVAIAVPPIKIQRIFASRVEKIDRLKAHHRASLAKLDALFSSLQHRAFQGEL
jgi:type I restriction enzyme, S subunit